MIGRSGSQNGIVVFNPSPEAGTQTSLSGVCIHNVTVEDVQPVLPSSYTGSDYAGIFVISFRNVTLSDSTIRNNAVTGISLFTSTIVLQRDITLTNNTGFNGGGVTVISNSFLILTSQTNLQVTNNTAKNFGGSFYVCQGMFGVTQGLQTYCFAVFAESKSKVVINLARNRASATGQNLYGGYLDVCIPSIFNDKKTKGVLRISEIERNYCNQTVVSSNAMQLLVCDQHCINSTTRTRAYPPCFPDKNSIP